jgi:PAS domain-containing protein
VALGLYFSQKALQNESRKSKQAEQERRKSEERFRSLFEEAPVAYLEIDKDAVVRRINRAGCHLLGWSSSEIVGKHICEPGGEGTNWRST